MLALNPKSYRIFNRVILGIAAGLILLFVSLNTWINPLWVTPTPWTDPAFAEYRPIYRHQRTGKAGLVRSTAWEVGFFGSSRVDIAYDPLLPGWEGKKVVNLAVSAGTLPETAWILRYTLNHCPIKTAIVGIDLGDLSGSGSGYKTTGFMESPFNPKSDVVERELRYLGGVSTFETSVKTLDNWMSRNDPGFKLPEYTPQGHRLRHQDKPNTRHIIYHDAIPHAMKGTRRRKHSPPAADSWKVAMVQQILDDTKQHKVALKIAIPPNHATYISVYPYSGDPDPVFGIDRGALTKLVAESNGKHPDAPPAVIWDFNDYHPLNCETIPPDGIRMHWWLDGTHARKALGDVMLARMMGWPIEGEGKDFGFLLTKENLEQRLASLKEGYVNFQKDHPDQWEWMAESIKSFETSGKGDQVEEGAQEF